MNEDFKKTVIKFQLSRITASHGKQFPLSEHFANFECCILKNDDMGTKYVCNIFCREMLFIRSNKVLGSKNITNPLNDGTIHYYSVHNDGFSNAKLFIIN